MPVFLSVITRDIQQPSMEVLLFYARILARCGVRGGLKMFAFIMPSARAVAARAAPSTGAESARAASLVEERSSSK